MDHRLRLRAAAASQRRLAQDVAELLASLCCIVGAERAVTSATAVLGPEAVGMSIPLLQPLALSGVTRHALRAHPGLLKELREVAARHAGVALAKAEPLTRVRPRTVLLILGFAFAIHLLLPQVGELRQTLDALGSASWGWLVVGLLASAATYLAAAVAQLGAVGPPLALGELPRSSSPARSRTACRPRTWAEQASTSGTSSTAGSSARRRSVPWP